MSQARVTDFFAQRKKCMGPTKAAKPRSSSRASARSQHKEPLSSAVHEEFLRVIEEATGPDPELLCPRTPSKRSSGAAEFDLGAAVFSAAAAAEHSAAKRSRAAAPGQSRRRTARKQLVLPQSSPQTLTQTQVPETETQMAPGHPKKQTSSSDSNIAATGDSTSESNMAPTGDRKKALSKDELSALKSRLQGIRKQSLNYSRSSVRAPVPEPAASAESPSSARTEPASSTLRHSTSPCSTSEQEKLKRTVARAKELAAKVQKRKEESEDKPEETQSAAQPAFQTYHTLSQAVPPGLSLPYAYKVLAETFRCMDTVVAMLFNRSETPTFAKIQKGVQDMTHRRFEESHVGQITAVFPEAYTLRQEKNVPTFSSSVKKGSFQLTVEPALVCDGGEVRPTLTATRLLQRRHLFHHNLLSLVKQHHAVFLSSLDPPLSVPEDKLSRWHPRFNVDTVPPVAPSPLPRPPQSEGLTTAQEVLDKARALMTTKMERALETVAQKSEEKKNEPKEAPARSCPAPAQTPAALRGVSQSLLERIRAKEAQKVQAAMTRDSVHEERLLMMSRLAELARILRNVFVAEKKPALIMEAACSRMMSSYSSALSSGEMEKHLRLLAEVVPEWLSIVHVRKDFYLKLNKNTELSLVQDKVRLRLKEEERL